MKTIFFLFVVAMLVAVGYLSYRGLTGDNSNAETIAADIGSLSESVTNTVKDGAVDIAKDIRNKADETKDVAVAKASKAADTAANTVKSRVGDIRKDVKKRTIKAKDTTVKKVKDVMK